TEVPLHTSKTVMDPTRSDTFITVAVASTCEVPELSIARMPLPAPKTIDEVVAAIPIPNVEENVPSFTFPDGVPSLRHTSVWVVETKKKAALRSSATARNELPNDAPSMKIPSVGTWNVPASVPSVFQRNGFPERSNALK